MSSGFVPAGTSVPEQSGDGNAADDAWAAARAKVAQAAQPKKEEPGDGRSLYEILQANKAKKQEEFEEKMKFKNQFKPLDEDDVEYLDSIVEEKKRAERERRMELEKELDKFRSMQSEADKPMKEEEVVKEEGGWKKRKRREGPAKGGLGVKVRRTSEKGEKVEWKEQKEEGKTEGEKAEGKVENKKEEKVEEKKVEEKKEPAPAEKPKPKPPVGGLGLVDYDSDSDDD